MNYLSDTMYTPEYHVSSEEALNLLSSHMLVDGYNLILDMDKSDGAFLHDKRTGRRFVDFFSFFASVPIGINHPGMHNADFINYMGKQALNKPSNSDIYTEGFATFVNTFFNIAVPDYFKYSFYIEGGALAVENALKTAFDWKVRKNFKKGYETEKGHQIIHFRQAFHGRTGYTMSLTNTDPKKINYFPKFTWPRITNPTVKFPLDKQNLEDVYVLEKQAVNEIYKALSDFKDDIAAIIIEPIQGEGGDNHFRPEFLMELRNIADENDILLIFDEVQTGGGLTGNWWAHQNHGVIPDILCFGKKFQVCGILVTDRIDEVEDNVFHTSSRINSTWGGNYVDMIRVTRYLEIIEKNNYVENAARLGDYLEQNLLDLVMDYNGLLSNARGMGLFRAIDIDVSKRSKFISKCYDNGLIILPCGKTSVRFRPPLSVTRDELDTGMEIIRNSLKEL